MKRPMGAFSFSALRAARGVGGVLWRGAMPVAAIPATALAPSFRRRPESILVFSFDVGVSREPAHVRVWFRPPSWRPSHFLRLPKESNHRKGTLEVAVTGHPCPLTPRAGSGFVGSTSMYSRRTRAHPARARFATY